MPDDCLIVEQGTSEFTVASCEECNTHLFSMWGFPDSGILIAKCVVCGSKVEFIITNITKCLEEVVDA